MKAPSRAKAQAAAKLLKEHTRAQRTKSVKSATPVTSYLLGAAAQRAMQGSRSGYGNYGASDKKIGLQEWKAYSGSPDEDITLNLPLLRARSRDLFMGTPLAAAAILTLDVNVVGTGLVPMPQVDGEVLGKSSDECAQLNKFLADEFKVFASTCEVDWSRRSTFYQLQSLVFINQAISGDILVMLPTKERVNAQAGSPYKTRVRLIEADRVMSAIKLEEISEELTDGGSPKIFGGVELSQDGEVVAYWVCNRHPANMSLAMISMLTEADFTRVPVFGEETGRAVALLVGEMERPEQRRAVPLMSKCLTELKNLSRYIESTTVQNVIKSYFTAFVTSQMPSTEMFTGLVDDSAMQDLITRDPYIVHLGPGIVNWLRPGDKIEFPINAGPESEFEPYVTALCKFIGAALGIPFEVLLKTFNASYSASRASLLQFWARVKVMRQMLVDQFCQPVYETWMTEGVAQGIIRAPGFSADPRIFRAWTRCSWSGASPGSIDPVKESQAAEKRMKLGVSTQERESLEINGSDWRANTIQQGLEKILADENDLPYPRSATPSPFGGGGFGGGSDSSDNEGDKEE
jgi:lambda family phage portal protein